MADTKIITYKEAVENGEKFYFTGKPCFRGHISKRRTINSGCLECESLLKNAKRTGQAVESYQKASPSRRAAIENGDKIYMSDKPCKNGHMAYRWVSNKMCVECHREKDHARRATRRESNRLAGKRQAGLRQAALDRGENRYFTGRSCPKGHIDWRCAMTSNCIACVREYGIKNRSRPENKKRQAIHAKMRKRHIRTATPKWADRSQLWAIYANCPEGFHVDHIIPLRGKLVSGLHVPENLQYLPANENYRKHNKFEPEKQSVNEI